MAGCLDERPLSSRSGIDFADAPVLIAGDSHMAAITGWKQHDSVRVTKSADIDGLFTLDGPWPRPEDYWTHLQTAVKESNDLTAALLYRGNDHLGNFLIRPDEPIDFFSQEFPLAPLDEEAELVAESFIEAFFRSFCEPVGHIVADIVGSGRRAIVIATPPPKRDEAFLRAAIVREPTFQNIVLGRGLTTDAVRFTPAFVRLKLWGAVCRVMRTLAEEAGADFLPVPPSAQDSDGFLQPWFWADDCTHANAAYGDLTLLHLSEYMNGRGTRPGRPIA